MAIQDIIEDIQKRLLLANVFRKSGEPTPLDKFQNALKGTGIFIVVVITGIVIIKVVGVLD